MEKEIDELIWNAKEQVARTRDPTEVVFWNGYGICKNAHPFKGGCRVESISRERSGPVAGAVYIRGLLEAVKDIDTVRRLT